MYKPERRVQFVSLEMKLLSLFVWPGRSALTQLTSLSWKRRIHCVLLSLLSSTNELELAAAVVYLLMKVRICSGATHTHTAMHAHTHSLKSEHVCTGNVQALNSRNNLSIPGGKKKSIICTLQKCKRLYLQNVKICH